MTISALLLTAGLMTSSTVDTLQSATFVADRGVIVSRQDTVSFENRFSITDVLLLNPSLSVSDNGGAAGLKTVSLRGFGSPHTDIYIDGVRVGNVQSGQCDLGMLGVENFRNVVIDYAQNSLSFNSLRPVFRGSNTVAGRAAFAAGSFGTYLPNARVDFRLSPRTSLSAHAAGIISRGDFPLPDGSKRQNNDIRQVRGGLDAFGATYGGDWHAKAWINSSDRGTPGAVTWPSTDRQQDLNFFAQGLVRQKFSPVYLLNASAKVSFDRISYASSWGDSEYRQTEVQLNTSHKFHVRRWLDFSLAADGSWDGLSSTVYDASRVSVKCAGAVSFNLERFSANLAAEYNGFFDIDGQNNNSLSPSLDLKFNAFKDFYIVAFGRRAYRVPTFNELYYVGYCNPYLLPEDAWLSDLGFDYNPRYGAWRFKLKLDGFYNYLNNKIVSAPSELDPNVWFPYNIGRVRAVGADAGAGFSYSDNNWNAGVNAVYVFQNAWDLATKYPVPYIARHSCTLDARCSYRGWLLSCVWNLRAGRSDAYGVMPDWNTLDITARKDVRLGRCGTLGFFVLMQNLTDCRYDLASGYPMQGRSFTGGVDFKF